MPRTPPPPHKSRAYRAGRGNIKSRINNRRLPWQLPLHHQAKRNAALQKEHRGQRAPLYDSSDSWGRSSMVAACLGANNLRRSESNGGGSAACTGTLSTTSKKTMESLSASVYDDLQPFRRAHRALIRVSFLAGDTVARTPETLGFLLSGLNVLCRASHTFVFGVRPPRPAFSCMSTSRHGCHALVLVGPRRKGTNRVIGGACHDIVRCHVVKVLRGALQYIRSSLY